MRIAKVRAALGIPREITAPNNMKVNERKPNSFMNATLFRRHEIPHPTPDLS